MVKNSGKGIQFSQEGRTLQPEEMPQYIRDCYKQHVCLSEFFQVRVEEARQGYIVLTMDLTPEKYSNSGGFLYGGILSALADAVSLGLIVSVGKMAMTIGMSMNFEKASPAEGVLRIIGRLSHNGKRTMAIRSEIQDGNGRLLAEVQTTMLVMGRLPEVPETW